MVGKENELMKGKKIIKKLVSVLLGGALFMAGLGGCGKSASSADSGIMGKDDISESGQAGGKGRFTETEVALPENVDVLLASARLQNGNLELFSWNDKELTFQLHISEDAGETWTRKELDEEKIAEVFGGFVTEAAIKPDGTVVSVSGEYVDGQCQSSRLSILSPDGTMEAKKLVLPDTELKDAEYTQDIVDCAFNEEGNFFVENLNSQIYKVDLLTGNAELFCNLEEEYVGYFAIAGNRLLAVSNSGISIFDTVSGEKLEADAVLNDMIAADPSLAEQNSDTGTPLAFTGSTEEDRMFYVNHDGLFCHTKGSSLSEQLINGTLNSMGDTTVEFVGLMMVDEEHFLLTVLDGSGIYKLLKYTYDKEAPSVPETELKVYALEDSTFLRQAISAYQKKNQDVYVNLQIGLSGEDGMTAEDAIRALGTDILSGKGPDVLILDGLPVDSYMEKGMLADIAPLVEKIASSDGVFENVKKAYEKDGAIYEFPARFYVSIVNGDTEAVTAGASLSDMAAYVTNQKAAGEENVFPVQGTEDLLERLYLTDSANWIDEDGKLKETAVKEYLTCAKQIYDINPNGDVYSYGGRSGDLIGNANAMGIILGEAKLGYGTLLSMMELTTTLAANKMSALDYELANSKGAKAFVPYQLAGIYSNTTKMEQAESFLEVLLGAECGSVGSNGFSVNKTAYDTICEHAKNQYDEDEKGGAAISTDEGVYVELEFENLTEDDVAKLTGILETVDKPVYMDRVVKEIILEQGEKVLTGDSTVDEAVGEIMKKCNLYLSE